VVQHEELRQSGEAATMALRRRVIQLASVRCRGLAAPVQSEPSDAPLTSHRR
jgi:hypothetical protein